MDFLNASADDIMNNVIGGTNLNYTCFNPESIDDIEQCLATLVTDISGSVYDYAKDILTLQQQVVQACKMCPRAENILFRNVTFNSSVNEIHGFVPLTIVDETKYPMPSPYGQTALFDATRNCVAATINYSDNLVRKDFITNSCIYIITDGQDNASSQGAGSIKKLIEEAKIKEKLIGKMYTVLIGLTSDTRLSSYLSDFKDEAGIDEYVTMGEANAKNLAKLAQLISKSISSHSQKVDSSILNF